MFNFFFVRVFLFFILIWNFLMLFIFSFDQSLYKNTNEEILRIKWVHFLHIVWHFIYNHIYYMYILVACGALFCFSCWNVSCNCDTSSHNWLYFLYCTYTLHTCIFFIIFEDILIWFDAVIVALVFVVATFCSIWVFVFRFRFASFKKQWKS